MLSTPAMPMPASMSLDGAGFRQSPAQPMQHAFPVPSFALHGNGSPTAAMGMEGADNGQGLATLSSYRHAGAALLRSLHDSNRNSGLCSWSKGTVAAAPSPAQRGTAPGGSPILSTSPGNAARTEATAVAASPMSFLSTPPPNTQDRQTASGASNLISCGSLPACYSAAAPTVSAAPCCAAQSLQQPVWQAQAFVGDLEASTSGLRLPQATARAPSSKAPTAAACREAASPVNHSPLPDSYEIKYTFIQSKPERSPSLERFLEERKCRSSPTSRPTSRPLSRQVSGSSFRREGLELEDPFAIATPTDSPAVTPRTSCKGGALMRSVALPDVGAEKLTQQAPPVLRLSQLICEPEGKANESTSVVGAAVARLAQEIRCGVNLAPKTSLPRPCPDVSSAACSTAAPSAVGSGLITSVSFAGSGTSSAVGSAILVGTGDVLLSTTSITDASRAELVQSKIGTQEIPSRGSALHPWACKPCAFVFQDGCANGRDCEFCHLCEPGERKRRKKERKKLAANWKVPFDAKELL